MTWRKQLAWVRWALLGLSAAATAACIFAWHFARQGEYYDIIVLTGPVSLDIAVSAFVLGWVCWMIIGNARLRLFGLVALLVGAPLGALVLSYMMAIIPHQIDRVALPDGRRLMLAYDDTIPTDTIFALWQADGARWHTLTHGHSFASNTAGRPSIHLEYSEDGSLTDDPSLYLTPDNKYLLVRRGGIWTDCIETTEPLRNCDGIATSIAWSEKDQWHARSRAITQLTGLSPDASGPAP